ncbi:MAG TPA: Rrf2 family transcriptional regulator [Treponemataceae bacterium]|jgi:Rrf2 family protein|nr:Rrf2 family transcriptional regulator [Treponemataceae bacterium]
MRISTRGRYGVRFLVDLAQSAGETHVPLAAIAERQRISARYLEHVAVILRRMGYVRSIKGASGGYALAREPADIPIGDVLRALEGDILVVDDPLPGETEGPLARCVRSVVYDRLNRRIADIVDRLTLADIVGGEGTDRPPMYYI